MSNTAVGEVYSRIITDVLDSSAIDFEEAGVASVVLRELGDQWRKKLTDLRVASFPWDPQPQQPQPVPDNKKINNSMPARVKPEMPQQSMPQQQQQQPMQLHSHQLAGGMHLKQEPTEQDGLGLAAANPDIAAMRAAQHIQHKFPTQEIPGGLQQAAIGGRPNGARPPGPALMLPGNIGQREIPQHDGASDSREAQSDGLAWRSNSGGVISREEADKMIEKQIKKGKGIPQLDGLDDDEEADEDAINSDLDDPDEDDQNDNEDDEIPQIMLCTYEKVQRTKNKWKCVLKDGVLTVNGKEYVFRKANGEYEW